MPSKEDSYTKYYSSMCVKLPNEQTSSQIDMSGSHLILIILY